MKKIISLLLALVMAFSMCTVAFAADGTAAEDITTEETVPEEGTADEGEAEEAGDFDWLLDLPFWTVKPAAKIAKLALKFAKIYVKLGIIFGFVDKNDIIGQIEDLIAGVVGGDTETEDAPADDTVTEEVPEENTAPAAA